MKQPLVVIAGPTACGKTGVSIALAKQKNGEIISGDSMQVYRGMNIGTAKATPEEMAGIPHHMIDVADPDEAFSVARFQAEAKAALREIAGRGKLPILVGGTGFYINALIKDNNFTETETDTSLRIALYAEAAENGPLALHARLREIDPDAAAAIHPNNVKRVARAIEYHALTGERISVHNAREAAKESPYDVAFIILTMERSVLYRRIETRVDQMLAQGLAEEVRGLLAAGYGPDLVSMRGLGYKELVPYVQGECTLEEAATELKKATRRFAKRQLTWFHGQAQGLWLDVTNLSQAEILKQITDYIWF